MSKILAFAGSAREGSYNKKLIAIAADGARAAGAQVTLIDLRDYPMPLYDADLETAEGMPEHAGRFKKLLIGHDGVLISSPEYNSAFSPLVKNAVDWASRKESQDEPGLAAFEGKVAAIMSASPGRLGGLRGLVFLRMLLGNLGVTVLPGQRAVGNASQAFAPDGSLKDAKEQEAVRGLGAELAGVLQKMRA